MMERFDNETITWSAIAVLSIIMAIFIANSSITLRSFKSVPEQAGQEGETIGSCRKCLPLKDSAIPVKEDIGEYLDANLIAKLQKLAAANKNWRLTEAYPPTVRHLNFCHQNGLCADLGLYPEKRTAGNLSILCRDAIKAGITIINEYSDPQLLQADSYCPASNVFETTTGGHLHIQ